MSKYIESRQQKDGSWKHYLTWTDNAKPEEEIIINSPNEIGAHKVYPVAFGCSLTNKFKAQYHNVIGNDNTKYDKMSHVSTCPASK